MTQKPAGTTRGQEGCGTAGNATTSWRRTRWKTTRRGKSGEVVTKDTVITHRHVESGGATLEQVFFRGHAAPIKNGSSISPISVNGIHRAERRRVLRSIFMHAMFPFVAKEAKN